MAIYTFPGHKPFIVQLSSHILQQQQAADLILLPSKRACQTLRGRLEHHDIKTPIISLGELVEHSYTKKILEQSSREYLVQSSISTIKRQLMLARMCMVAGKQQSDHSITEPQAVEIAGALASLLDEFQRQEIPLNSLQKLVPDEYAEHWQRILEFLNIIALEWPKILQDEELLDPIAHRNEVYKTVLKYWEKENPGKIIIAGSTASNKSVATMMRWVAKQKDGEVILPALPLDCDEGYWQQIDAAHPYYYMRRFLELAECKLGDITLLDYNVAEASADESRIDLLHHSFVPAALASTWQSKRLEARSSLEGVQYIEAANDLEQIHRVVSICQNNKDKSICIVSERKSLSQQIQMALDGFNLQSSASESLSLKRNDWAVFFMQLLLAAEKLIHPVHMLSILKHDIFQTDEQQERKVACWLEQYVLRQGTAYSSMNQLLGTVQACEQKGLAPEAIRLLEKYNEMIAPLHEALRYKKGFSEILLKHIECMELASRNTTYQAEQHKEFMDFLSQLKPETVYLGQVDCGEYEAILDKLMGRELQVPHDQENMNIKILPSEEARLETADIIIVMDFNEGSWPAEASINPWLSRPMQRSLGFDLDHMRASRMAHDYMMLAHAKEFILIRPLVQDDALTMPSRWLQRLKFLLKAQQADGALEVSTAREEQKELSAIEFSQPSPVPPVSARPRKLSISDLELLQRDPYSIYAKHITKLKPVGELVPESNQAVYGIILHRILELFCREHPEELPKDGLDQLNNLLHGDWSHYGVDAAVSALWTTRLSVALSHYYRLECERRPTIKHVMPEVSLSARMDIAGEPFEVFGRADRIEIYQDGTAALIDYKTGGLPLMRDVQSLIACQLPVGAWLAQKMLKQKNIDAAIDKVEYWRFHTSGVEVKAPFVDMSSKATLEKIEAHITQLLSSYAEEGAEYTALPDATIAPTYSSYLHLERVEEWA